MNEMNSCLLGNAAMYLASGGAEYLNNVYQYTSPLVHADGDMEPGICGPGLEVLFFLHQVTGEERFLTAAGKQALLADVSSIELQPFLTKYETVLCHKEHYGRITALFEMHPDYSAADLVSLADTIEVMSEEIYEHYRMLQDIFRREVRRFLEMGVPDKDTAAFGLAVMKACRTGTLLREKYQRIGEHFWRLAADHVGDPSCGDNNNTGMRLKCRAEYIRLNKQEV